MQLHDQYAIDSDRGYFDETHLANMSKHLKESKPFKNDNAVERNKTFQNQKIMENDALDLFGEADKLEASIEEAATTLDKQNIWC